ncbi:MAG: hydroxypyruvate isomerase, partial [Pseudarthrobacter sp.]|nr:hydroxypyruvate isomerase [Pseudarthrobacter sp.]
MTYTVNCSILLTELPLLERPAAAKAAGFDAVEFWWPFETSVPTDAQVSAFETAIKDAGVQLTGLNFNAGNMPGGDRGLVSWKGRCSEFKDNIDVVAGIG